MTLREFKSKYGDDETCLQALFQVRYGSSECAHDGCHQKKLYRIKKRKSWACGYGHHTSPMANTIFRKTTTPLSEWFYVIYMFSQTKHGVSSREVARIMGYSYKTAWRMCRLIRSTMGLDINDADESVYLKRQFSKSIKGTHNWVSDTYFRYYLAEFIFRYQYRKSNRLTEDLMDRVMNHEQSRT